MEEGRGSDDSNGDGSVDVSSLDEYKSQMDLSLYLSVPVCVSSLLSLLLFLYLSPLLAVLEVIQTGINVVYSKVFSSSSRCFPRFKVW